ncbi:MAG: fibronectin type III domain-containing protein [Aeromicrobium sp.]
MRDAPHAPRRRKTRDFRLPAVAAVVLVAAGGFGATTILNQDRGPVAPHGLTAIDTAAEMVSLQWKPVAEADTYEVVVSDKADMTKHRTYVAKTPKVQIPDLRDSTEYFIKVRAVSASENNTTPGAFSSIAKVETAEAPDPATITPTGLKPTTVSSASIAFSWEPIAKATKYELEYSKDKRLSGSRRAEAEDTATAVGGLDPNTQYYFRLRAKGEGDKFGKASAILPVKTVIPAGGIPLRVISYNVRCHSCGGPSWGQRRPVLVQAIAAQNPDVIGVQEALQSRPPGSGHSQFEDLRAALSATGTEYRVTQTQLESSKGSKIYYKPSKVTLLKAGSVRYGTQLGGRNPRYFAWAIFRQRATGQDFIFTSTQLEHGRGSTESRVRLGQTRQLISAVASLNKAKLPAILVGDYNDYQYLQFAVQPMMHNAGYIDPLGIQNRSRTPAPWASAEKRINTNFDSFNDGRRHASVRTGNPNLNGTYLDYIFTTPMRVPEFENVVNIDGNGNFKGTIPSDHNMMRADVVLPQ